MLTVDFNKVPLEPGMKVLDAGCGTGRHLCEAYRRSGVHVTGIDLNWSDLEKSRTLLHFMSRERNGDGGAWLVSKGDVTRLPFKDASFDVVVCSEVLEHIPDNRGAVAELMRVLKPGREMVVSVPRWLPERICWVLSRPYHEEPGGHIRIYRKRELKNLLESAGADCHAIRYRHSLHSPYWWLKCLVGHKNEQALPVRLYRRFLEWDIMKRPNWTRWLDSVLNPFIAKSVVFYLRKGSERNR